MEAGGEKKVFQFPSFSTIFGKGLSAGLCATARNELEIVKHVYYGHIGIATGSVDWKRTQAIKSKTFNRLCACR